MDREQLQEIEREAVARSPFKSSSTCRVCGRFLQDPTTDRVRQVRENAQGCCDSHLRED